jgi:hypothetical protein
MVMFTYGIQKEGISGDGSPLKKRAAELILGSPPLTFGNVFRLGYYFLPIRACNPMQDFVHGFLNTRIGLMELPRSLGCKLAKHITVSQGM